MTTKYDYLWKIDTFQIENNELQSISHKLFYKIYLYFIRIETFLQPNIYTVPAAQRLNVWDIIFKHYYYDYIIIIHA